MREVELMDEISETLPAPTAAELEIIARNDREVGTAVAEAYVRWREEYGEKRRRALEAFGLEPERELFG